jgi:diphthamide synthase (EF-2-diphthine--ammonia ligase)
VRAQARAAGLPLWEIPLPWPCKNDEYELAMGRACAQAVEQGITGIAFGDLFLEDVRKYREDRLKGTGLEPIFPVWGLDTKKLIGEMLDQGLRARIVCVDPKKLSENFAGQDISRELLAQFPQGIDPCGENGEFHTFVHAGPMFSAAIPIQIGEVVTRESFVFADVLLSTGENQNQLPQISQTLA